MDKILEEFLPQDNQICYQHEVSIETIILFFNSETLKHKMDHRMSRLIQKLHFQDWSDETNDENYLKISQEFLWSCPSLLPFWDLPYAYSLNYRTPFLKGSLPTVCISLNVWQTTDTPFSSLMVFAFKTCLKSLRLHSTRSICLSLCLLRCNSDQSK